MNVDRMRKYALKNYPDQAKFTINLDDPEAAAKAQYFYNNFWKKMVAKHGIHSGAKVESWVQDGTSMNPTYLLVYKE